MKKMLNKLTVVGIIMGAFTYNSNAGCNVTHIRPCGDDVHQSGSCGGIGNQSKWTNDFTFVPDMDHCDGVESGGLDGCADEQPQVSCYEKITEKDCEGNVTVTNIPSYKVTPQHATGNAC